MSPPKINDSVFRVSVCPPGCSHVLVVFLLSIISTKDDLIKNHILNFHVGYVPNTIFDFRSNIVKIMHEKRGYDLKSTAIQQVKKRKVEYRTIF